VSIFKPYGCQLVKQVVLILAITTLKFFEKDL
jgi:hypothetical protein